MNESLKDVIYSKGTHEQVELMKKLGGMTEEEKQLFQLIHEGYTDEAIRMKMSLSRKSYQKIEENVRVKLNIAIFDCINYRLQKVQN